jgi:aryl carrier-like protein
VPPSVPIRKRLNIDLVTDPAARDCVEDILASVICWWGRRHEVMYASSWGFDFEPGSGELMGSRLDAEISPALDLLETLQGIRVSVGKEAIGADLFALTLKEICGGRPVILSGSKRSAESDANPRFVLALGFDRLRQALNYKAVHPMAEDPEADRVVHTLPLNDLANWSGPHATFMATENGAVRFDWRPILRDAVLRLHDLDDRLDRFEMMTSFADEIRTIDIKAELHGYQKWYWVPLFYNLRRVSQGRFQFSSLLEWLANRFHIGGASSVIRSFKDAGRSWQLVRSLLIKHSLSSDDRMLLDRIASRVNEVAAAKRQLAVQLSRLVDSDPSHKNGHLVKPEIPAVEKQTTDSSLSRQRPEYAAPRSAIEEALARIWEDVLGFENVGVHDNFFDLGGDSLLGMKILARMHQAGLRLGAGQIYERQTIEELAEMIAVSACGDAGQDMETGSMPFLPLQYKGISEDGSTYQREGAVEFYLSTPHDLTSSQLDKVAHRLLAHHDALRLRFPLDFENRHLSFSESSRDSRCWRRIDLSDDGHWDSSETLSGAVEQARSVIDLQNGPLFVLLFFETPFGKENVLCMRVHHVVSDAISNGILEEDIITLVGQASGNGECRLPPKTTSIKQWSQMLVDYVGSHDSLEIDYWKSKPWGKIRPILPDRSDETSVDSSKLTSVELTLGSQLTRSLLTTCRILRITVHEFLLAGLAETLARWSGSDVVLIEHIHHGRDPILEGTDLSRTVGFFSLEVPLVFELTAVDSRQSLLQEISAQIRRMPAKGIGYSLLRYLSKDKEIVRFLESIPTYQARYNAVIEPSRGDSTDGEPAKSCSLDWHETPTSQAPIHATPFTLENKPRMEGRGLVLPLRFGQKGLFHRDTIAHVVDCYASCLEDFAGLGDNSHSVKPRIRECS